MSILILAGASTLLINPTPQPPSPPISPNPPPAPPHPQPPPCPTITVSPAMPPNGAVGVAYSQQFTASGGSGPYTFTSTGTMPAGLVLSPSGLLSGIPTVAGIGHPAITATDANGCFTTLTAQIQIAQAPVPPCPPIVVTPTALASGQVGVAYSQQLAASGGAAPYTFAASALPASLSMTSGGLITGIPTVAASTPITFTATDNNGCTGTLSTTIVVTAAAPAPPPPQTGLTLLPGPGALVYQGAFRLPRGATGTDHDSFSFGGGAAVYNPANNSLILAGMPPSNGVQQSLGEVVVPTPIIAPSVAALPFASFFSGPSLVNPLGSKINLVDPGGGSQNYIGGFALANGKLVISAYIYYDGAGTGVLSHFLCQAAPPYAYISGPFQVGTKGAGWVGGPMCPVPASLVAGIGAPWLTGQGTLPIISRTSSGPSMSGFDPSQLGVAIPDPATLLVGYDLNTHETLGSWGGAPAPSGPTLFNGATTYPGAVILGRTLLFGGRLGNGVFCYGVANNDPTLQGKPGAPDPAFPNWCYDPTAGPPSNPTGPGTFDSSYGNQLLAYDLNDLVAVKAGSKNYWDVVPYANWGLTFPLGPSQMGIASIAVDTANSRLFVLQKFGDGYAPLVHVYTYTLAIS